MIRYLRSNATRLSSEDIQDIMGCIDQQDGACVIIAARVDSVGVPVVDLVAAAAVD